jgi:hypothetical protein
LDLSSDNWVILEDLVKCLQPFEIATVLMNEESNVSLSSIVPIIHGLINQLASVDKDSAVISEFKIIVTTALKRRWSIDVTPNCVQVLSTALYPHFPSLNFLNSSDKLVTRDAIKNNKFVKDMHVQPVEASGLSSTSTSPKRKKSAFDVLL